VVRPLSFKAFKKIKTSGKENKIFPAYANKTAKSKDKIKINFLAPCATTLLLVLTNQFKTK
jgi:hypothetical protein